MPFTNWFDKIMNRKFLQRKAELQLKINHYDKQQEAESFLKKMDKMDEDVKIKLTKFLPTTLKHEYIELKKDLEYKEQTIKTDLSKLEPFVEKLKQCIVKLKLSLEDVNQIILQLVKKEVI